MRRLRWQRSDCQLSLQGYKSFTWVETSRHRDKELKFNDGWAWRLTWARGEQVAAHRCSLRFSSASVSGGGCFGYGIVLCGRPTPAFWGIPAHLGSKIIPNGSTWLPNGRCYLALAESLLMQLGNGSGSGRLKGVLAHLVSRLASTSAI
jgi:hypothetical protein